MHLRFVILFAVIVGCFVNKATAANNRIHCYLGTWAYWRPDAGKFDVDDIDPTLCDTIIYAFVAIYEDGTVHLWDSWLDVELQAMARFNAHRARNPNLKTLLAVGGWNEGSTKYSNAAANPTSRANFVRSAVEMVRTYGFDGFDVDWEYPNQGGERGGVPADVQNFVVLLKELRAALEPHGLLLTAAVGATQNRVDTSYDVPAISQYLDYIHIMAYDLHGAFDDPKIVGHNAPLYPSAIDVTDVQKQLSVDHALRYWLAQGADPQKILLGLATYGRTFTLESAQNASLGANFTGPGPAGPYTREAGNLGYNEICEGFKEGGWTEVWDDVSKVPHAVKDKTWIGYDNARSLSIKADYARSMNLAGVFIWSIETDDFRGNCGQKYILLNSLRSVLGKNETCTC